MFAVFSGRMGRGFRLILVVASLSATPVSVAPASELDGVMEMCGDGKLCPWFKTRAAAPKGWVEAKDWTKRYKAVFFFEGGDQSSDKPLIYVRTHAGQAAQALGDYIKGAQDKWKAKSKGSSISPQDDVPRAGKPAFKIFLYNNPEVPAQLYELTGFTKDTDPAHENQTYFQQAVLVAPSKEALDAARPAFEELLGRL